MNIDIELLPKYRKFWVVEAANILYPDGIKLSADGKTFNRCCAVTARRLRKDPRYYEVEYRRFILNPWHVESLDENIKKELEEMLKIEDILSSKRLVGDFVTRNEAYFHRKPINEQQMILGYLFAKGATP